jgi:hypothetical protein
MAISFKFYHDAALTQEITTGNPLTATQDAANLLAAVDKTIYFGSTVTGNKVQTVTSPGTNPVIISIVDANSGTGAPATEFKLALSSGGLATATAGAALPLSNTINSGVANAVPIYTRRDSVLTTPGTYTDLSLQSNSLTETPV